MVNNITTNNTITNEQRLNASLSYNNFRIELSDMVKDVIFDELFNYLEIELNNFHLGYKILTPLNYGYKISHISHLSQKKYFNMYENKNLNKTLYFMFGFNSDIHDKLYKLRTTIDKENRSRF